MFYNYTENLRNIFAALTVIVIGSICFIKIGTIDLRATYVTATILIPATMAMGFLGQKMGEIIDNPKNRADADYKVAVLDALKKMDKSITLQELNDKLTKQVNEPDIPDIKDDVDE